MSLYLTMVRCRGVIALDHTQGHTTVGRTPLDEGSAPQRPLPDSTQRSQQTNIHAPGGIRTHNPSRSASLKSNAKTFLFFTVLPVNIYTSHFSLDLLKVLNIEM
jgi:hypothetical protein